MVLPRSGRQRASCCARNFILSGGEWWAWRDGRAPIRSISVTSISGSRQIVLGEQARGAGARCICPPQRCLPLRRAASFEQVAPAGCALPPPVLPLTLPAFINGIITPSPASHLNGPALAPPRAWWRAPLLHPGCKQRVRRFCISRRHRDKREAPSRREDEENDDGSLSVRCWRHGRVGALRRRTRKIIGSWWTRAKG